MIRVAFRTPKSITIHLPKYTIDYLITEGILPANSEELVKLKCVPILIIRGLGTRTGSTHFFSTTARFCKTNDEIIHFRLLVWLHQLAK